MARTLTTDDIKKITELVELLSPAMTNQFAVDDGTGAPKRLSLTNLASLFVPYNSAQNSADFGVYDVSGANIVLIEEALVAMKGTGWTSQNLVALADAITAIQDSVGTANGIASLGASGLVPSAQLPSYVDDVLEYDTFGDFPVTGEDSKIYIALDTDLVYRWSGTVYTEISKSLALGETSLTAYRGDRGKVAYDHSQLASGNPHGVTPTDLGLEGVVDDIATLEADVTTPGSVLKSINDNAEDAVFTDTSGLDSLTLANAINEIYAEKAVASGLASLDATGKVPASQLPVSAMEFKGAWDASTEAYPVSPDTGDYYIISVAGTISGVALDVGDAIVYDGTAWQHLNKVEIAEEISLTSTLYTATNVKLALEEIAGTGRVDETVKGNADDIATLEADVTTDGSVLKSIKDNAQTGTFTPVGDIDAVTIGGALGELDSEKATVANLALTEARVTRLENVTTIKSWADVQDILRAGAIANYISVGDQLGATYKGVAKIWDAIGIDKDTPTDGNFTHSLTLQSRTLLGTGQVSAPQAMYNAVTALPAGTHIFTTNGAQYQVTTSVEIPAGGVLFIATRDDYVPLTLTSYQADRVTTIETGLDVTTVTGTDTLTPINDHARMRYGSNNWTESALKQWINSEDATFEWESKTLYDMPSTYETEGFLNLLDPELVAVLGAVDKQVSRNTVNEGGGQDTFSDKVFLLSRKEVGLGDEGTITDEFVYPFWETASDADRIKGAPSIWWLRSPSVGHTYYVRTVYYTGALYNYIASHAVSLSLVVVVV